MSEMSGNLLRNMGIAPEGLPGVVSDVWRDVHVLRNWGNGARKARRLICRGIQRQAREKNQDGIRLWRRANAFTVTRKDKRPVGAAWKEQ